jgi:hypothetical protein
MTVEKTPPDQPELALDPAEIAEHGDPDFEANDAGDLNHSEADEDKEAPEPVKAEAEVPEVKADGEVEEAVDDEKAELEQLRKTTKALGKRVSVLSKEKRELSTKLQNTIKPVAQEAEAPAEGDEPQRADYKTKAEFDLAVQAETDRRVAMQDFNSKCNAVETAGSKTFGDKWPKAKADLAMLDDQGRIPMDLLSVALETDNPARVIFVLGNDIEKATELMGMTPIKRAIAMDKIASAKPAERPQSRTPPPIDPLGGKGGANDKPSDRDDDAEWNRKEAIRERRVADERRKLRGY